MANLIDGLDDFVTSSDNKFYSPSGLSRKILESKKVVFFTGAGFSKAWSDSYPAGLALFALPERPDNCYNFVGFAEELGVIYPQTSQYNKNEYEQACYKYFKDVKFHLDIYKRYPSLMPSFLDKTIISALEREIVEFIKKRFSSLVGNQELQPKLPSPSKRNTKIKNFVNFFNRLLSQDKEISFITTNYDFVLEKLLYGQSMDALSINRGLINKKDFNERRWSRKRVSLFKINGGFEIDGCEDNVHINYDFEKCASNIILPSQEQNYDNKYFKSVFIKSAHKLRDANLLVFIGYSLPDEDHTIRFLLKNFIDSNFSMKEIIVVDRDGDSACKVREKIAGLYPTLEESEAIFSLDGSFIDLINETAQ